MRSWTLNQLRTFIAVARIGTMSAAAVELGYSVGAISQQMQTLQHEAGTALFIKDGRNLLLSDAGHILLGHAHRILAAGEAASTAIDDLGNGIDSTVRLGIFGSGALSCISPTIEDLCRSDPNIRVSLQEIDPENALSAVSSGAVDIALHLEYSDHPEVRVPSFDRKTILTEPLLVVGHIETPVQTGSMEELRSLGERFGWLLPSHDSTFGRTARGIAAGINEDFDSPHTVTDTGLALGLSATGHGLTIASRTMLDFHQSAAKVFYTTNVTRSIVSLAKSASMQRPSVHRVQHLLELSHSGRA